MPKTVKRSKTDALKTLKSIHIKGARTNNLKNIELEIPKEQLIVVTGLSGSGKSSLVMDTLYAEGQRRYVESLSSYARQFLSRMKKPEVDFIKGISPAIAVEQKVSTSNARSTVGSLTEIYDYLRLLFGRIGVTISPVSGKAVKKNTITDVVNYLWDKKEGSRIHLYILLNNAYKDRSLKQELDLLLQKGYTRILLNNELQFIEDFLESGSKLLVKKKDKIKKPIYILIDRFVIDSDEENKKRIADSVTTSFYEGGGECYIDEGKKKFTKFNNKFELDGITFLEPTHQLFNYNNPFGACPQCEGYGRVLGIDENKVVPNKTLSVQSGAVFCWKGEKSSRWQHKFILAAEAYDFPVHRPYEELTEDELELLWNGNVDVHGIYDYFTSIEKKSYKIQNRVMLARYRGRTTCPTCRGGRLRKEAQYVFVGGKRISELIKLPIDELQEFFKKVKLSKYDKQLASRILLEINMRLQTMMDVGLSYLDLNRVSASLSGGETQRINLTRTIGSNLTNSIYILDEPSIGLHPKDTEKLVKVLKNLRDLKNTVIVVEHEEDVIRNADHIIDIGPKAGVFGGELVFSGPYKQMLSKKNKGLTRLYLTKEMSIAVPSTRRKFSNKILLKGVRQHNIKNIDVTIPLGALTVVTGVSGSGKTSLVKHVLYPAIKKDLGESFASSMGLYDSLEGDTARIDSVEMINQNPIGKSSRSNPVTYVKAWDAIRKLYTGQQLSKIRAYKLKHFSFNIEGGRCENCKGEGEITVEMQFLADVKLTCEDCGGKKFKDEILEVEYKGKNIFDILNMSIDESIEFFEDKRAILNKLLPLQDVGLGYVQLGQASSTLSGGEAQRVKLASFLGKSNSSQSILFIFDEPTTGLHFHDINKLLTALNALIEQGHTVLVVEHNMEVIKSADWIIDLGPDGGVNGGNLVFEGRPEDLVKVKGSHTGKFLKEKLK